MLAFPSEGAGAYDWGDNGMVGAVGDLIDAGRVKLYCVDSFDAASWSNRQIPLEERARAARPLRVVDPRPGRAVHPRRRRAARSSPPACSLGAFHAANFALKRADLFPLAICMSGNYDPSTWHGWGERGESDLLQQPDRLRRRTSDGDHLDWLRSRLSLLLVVGQGAVGGHHRVAASPPGGSPGCSPTRACATSSTSGGTTSPTTGRPGAPNWPTTSRGSADVRTTHAPDRPAARHRGGLAARLRDAAGAGRADQGHGGHDAPPDASERITIEPFDLRDKPRYDLVVDRLAWWYFVPREWLKKVALMDDVYLLN